MGTPEAFVYRARTHVSIKNSRSDLLLRHVTRIVKDFVFLQFGPRSAIKKSAEMEVDGCSSYHNSVVTMDNIGP